MMIEKTEDDNTELVGFVDSILDDQNMHKMIMAINSGSAGIDNFSIVPRTLRNEIINVSGMNNSKPMLKK